jgi:hypothetical protein
VGFNLYAVLNKINEMVGKLMSCDGWQLIYNPCKEWCRNAKSSFVKV